MAKPDYMLKSKLKFKTYAILGVMGFAMWMVFKPGNKTIEQPKTVQQTFIPQPYATKEKEPEPEFDFVTYLFKNFHPQVTSLIRTTERTVVVIDFIDVENSWVHQAMTDEDFKILGYETYETANGLLVKNKENSYVISRRQPFQTRDIKYRNKSQQMQTQ